MKIGFIGLGIMGRPMAKNLVKAGYDLTVYDLNEEAVADLVSCGARAADSSREASLEAEVVITMVPIRHRSGKWCWGRMAWQKVLLKERC